MTPLGTALKAARLAAGLDVRAAATLLALSQSAIYNLECGSWHPGRARLDGIAAAYGVTGEALDALRKLRAPDGDVTFGWSALQRRNTELAHLRNTDTSRSALTASRVAAGLTGTKLAALVHGCTPSLLASLETGRTSPLRRIDGRWRAVVHSIAAALGSTPEELWPDVVPSIPSGYIDTRDVPTPEELASLTERRFTASKIVATLTARERDVLRRRFGDDEETLEQCGEVHGVSKERVRQIESRALATLRTRFSLRGITAA